MDRVQGIDVGLLMPEVACGVCRKCCWAARAAEEVWEAEPREVHVLTASFFCGTFLKMNPSGSMAQLRLGDPVWFIFHGIKFAFLTFKLKNIFIFLFDTPLRSHENFPGCTTIIQLSSQNNGSCVLVQKAISSALMSE